MRLKEKWLPRSADPMEPTDIYDHLTERWGVVLASRPDYWIIPPTALLDQDDVELICATHNGKLLLEYR